MVSVARLKRLVQGLTLVAATAYTTLLLYQSVSTTVASSTSRLPFRQQVRFVYIRLRVRTYLQVPTPSWAMIYVVVFWLMTTCCCGRCVRKLRRYMLPLVYP